MYYTLLDAIYSANQIETGKQKQEYLQYLQDSARKLWEAYQTQNISISYSKHEYQEVYLLRYFFPYSKLVPYILNRLITKDLSVQLEDELLTASFFGCGPGPELYGLMDYLGDPKSGVAMISAAMFDIASSDWQYSREIVSEHLLDQVWGHNLYEICAFESDLAGESSKFLSKLAEKIVEDSNLIVIQNCLNEICDSRHEQLIKNIEWIVERMKNGALMLIIERYGYSSVKKLLGKLHSLGTDRNEIAMHPAIANPDSFKPILDAMPKELTTLLFSGDKLQLAQSVKFCWLATFKL